MRGDHGDSGDKGRFIFKKINIINIGFLKQFFVSLNKGIRGVGHPKTGPKGEQGLIGYPGDYGKNDDLNTNAFENVHKITFINFLFTFL